MLKFIIIVIFAGLLLWMLSNLWKNGWDFKQIIVSIGSGAAVAWEWFVDGISKLV